MIRVVNGMRCDIDLGAHSEESIAALLRSTMGRPRGERLSLLAQKFLGTPFAFETRLPPIPDDCLRVCLASFDCITLIYHLIALALAEDFDEYVDRLYRVRYMPTASRSISNDPEKGTIFDFACEALLENAVDQAFVMDITAEVAGDIRLMPIKVKLTRMRRPKQHDEIEAQLVPRFGERSISSDFIPSQHLGGIARTAVKSGDIILFTLGAVAPNGAARTLLVRHAAVALCESGELHFIHASKDFCLRRDNAALDSGICTGRFLNDDPRCELIGVGVAGCYAGDENAVDVEGVRYFAYDQSRPRPLEDYARENFVGVKFLRLVD